MTSKNNNIRFDSDNHKYLIVDQINDEEVLVKEAYLQDNIETYSEEKYVKKVKYLYTEERETYYMKRSREREKYYNDLVSQYKTEEKNLRKEYAKALGVLKDKIAFLENIDFESAPFDRLKSFLLGEYKYLVILNYDPRIEEFDDIIAQGELYYYGNNYRYEGMKLITLYGGKDCGLSWQLNRWSDGSGSNTEIVPCKTMAAAKDVLTEHLNKEKELGKKQIEIINKYNLPVDSALIKSYEAKIIEVAKNRVVSATKSLKEAEDDLVKLIQGGE